MQLSLDVVGRACHPCLGQVEERNQSLSSTWMRIVVVIAVVAVVVIYLFALSFFLLTNLVWPVHRV